MSLFLVSVIIRKVFLVIVFLIRIQIVSVKIVHIWVVVVRDDGVCGVVQVVAQIGCSW